MTLFNDIDIARIHIQKSKSSIKPRCPTLSPDVSNGSRVHDILILTHTDTHTHRQTFSLI